MKTINLVQGTPEWNAHRLQHLNASDAPAMLGCSPHKSRSQLVRETATGIAPEIDAATQRRFDDGHRCEALARPLAEQIIGEELFPCTGVEGKYSASFDGLTMLEDVAWEHKRLNDRLRAAMVDGCTGADLPEDYQVQMEHQAMVSGAGEILFMASHWDADDNLVEERHCWYYPNTELRARIVAGWEQFEADVAAYEPEAVAPKAATGKAPDALPALSVVARGMVEHSNHIEFRERALAAIAAVNRDLQTDDDFATAEQTVKAFKSGEEMLEATRQQILGQMADVDAVMRTIDEVQAELRRVRLDLDKLVTREKESRKSEIVEAGLAAVLQHYATINVTLGEHALQMPSSIRALIGSAIKGKRTIATIRDAADVAVAQAKIDASQVAERVRACIAVLGEFDEHRALFADRVQLCLAKAPEDLRNLAATRVAEFQRREAERLEAERERIRKEEAERLEREQRVTVPEPAPAPATAEEKAPASVTVQAMGAAVRVTSVPEPTPAAAPAAQIKLGDINAWIAPLTITADGLASLGFRPVAAKGAAKLYAGEDFPRICDALAQLIASAPARATQAVAA